MANITNKPVDLNKLPASALRDIKEYCAENGVPMPATVYDALHCYLMWNSIIGYTSMIASIACADKED